MNLGKLDGRLAARYERYLRARERPEAGSPGDVYVHVSVIFSGDPARLEAAGLHRRSVYGPVAYGSVRMADLQRLVDLPEVERVAEQSTARPRLDKSVPEAQVPPLWEGTPSLRGTDVVVGIVDTGIDIFHNSFRKSDGKTRILFLWDQTLDEAPHPPDFHYGKHYTDEDINAALDAGKFEHFDVDGHGTHVAGTAAGNGSQSGNCHGSDHYVGVAPDADLIIVKSEFREETYVDGVRYIFNMAGAKPAVANLSLGSGSDSHDGTSSSELALDAILQPNPESQAVVVANGNSADKGLHAHKSVGANGSATMRFTVLESDRFYVGGYIWYGSSGPIDGAGAGADARLRVTLKAPDGTTKSVAPGNPALTDEPFAGGRVDFSAFLDVVRVGRHLTEFELAPPPHGTLAAGEWEIEVEEISPDPGTATEVDCWLGPYPQWRAEENIAANGTKTLTFNVGENLAGTSSCRITYSGDARISIKVTTPDPDSTSVVGAGAGIVSHDAGDDHTVRFNSRINTPSGGQHIIEFWINVKEAGKNVDKGSWTITLEETAGHGTDYTAVFPEERPWATVRKADGTSVTRLNEPNFIETDQEPSRTVESPAAAQNVIAVGAYDPSDGSLATFSSRGPTVDGRQKPDLCAPGVAITAPKTRVKDSPCISDCCETFYTNLQGTSMAAPHVTGVVALMLQRNGTLDFEAIRTALRDHVVPVPGGDPNDWGQGKLNAQASVMSVALPDDDDDDDDGGGGGGGGGGLSIRDAGRNVGAFLPSRATWPLNVPTPKRIEELFQALAVTCMGRLIASLVSRHYDEVKAIVDGSRRAAVAWHRMQGPELLRIALSWPGEPRPIIPAAIGDVPVARGIERLLQVVAPAATPALQADIEHYRRFVVALPGVRLRDLEFAESDDDGD